VAAIVLAAATGARAEQLLLPGLMGFNALPALRNADPVVGPYLELEASVTAQFSGPIAARDSAATPYFRVTIPFREVAALELDGMPFELFQSSSATQARLAARLREGVAPGDVRVGARFLLGKERQHRPALGLQIVVKSTTGKGLESFRFTDAPAYVFDLLAGKDLLASETVSLRALGKVGFLSWQVAQGRQDDAVDFGATLRGAFASGASLAMELRGYAGWRGYDKPMVLGVTAGVPARPRVDVRATVDYGLTADAPRLDLRLGVVLHVDGPMVGG
jgi:hypothetical protein